jgi:hypothetical protein
MSSSARRRPGEGARERFLSVPDLFPERISQRIPAAVEPEAIVAAVDLDFDDLLRLRYRQRLQAHRVEQPKHGRVGSGSERE